MSTYPINEQVLDEKLAQLESVRRWSPRVISKLENMIRTADDYELFRINPFSFAAKTDVDESEALDLFLHAANLGLFEMEWHMLCAFCAHVFKSFAALKNVYNHFVCDFCYAENSPSLDDYIHVSFTIAPRVRDNSYRHPERLPADDLYYRYHFSRDVKGMPDGTPLVDFLVKSTRILTHLEPGEKHVSELEISPGIFSGKDLGNSTGFTFFVGAEEEQEQQTLTLRLSGGRFKALAPPLMQMRVDYGAAIFNFDQCAQIPGGPVSVEVENAMEQRNSLFAVQYPPDLEAVPLEFNPFLSGKKLLSTQTFRNLFRSEAIGSDEGLAVKDLTHLFTDLEGSTALYDRIGDPNAYALVRRHFDALGEVIAFNRGAIVKTVGDAIHASFPDPVDAIRAALEMIGALDEFNRSTSEQLLLKIGLHKGQSLAVMLNDRIDYFGQAVNIAARVQHMAGAREIYLSQELYDHPGVSDLLSDHEVTSEEGIMKGVSEKLLVYRAIL